MAINECARHNVIQPYEVLVEREGVAVVQCKMQVLLLPSGTLRVTAGSLPTDKVKSEYKVTDAELFKLINTSISGKSKKKPAAKKVRVCSASLLCFCPLVGTSINMQIFTLLLFRPFASFFADMKGG
jgi:hypothetical protein